VLGVPLVSYNEGPVEVVGAPDWRHPNMRHPLALSLLLLCCLACGTATNPGTGGGSATWHRDVSPIVQRSCLGCHVPGGIAPFPLQTYAQARASAAAMADAVHARRMPPWMPDPACGGPFIGERLLPQADIDALAAWAAAGGPEGDPADAPGPQDAGIVELPHVDATLAMTAPYTPDATLTDDYRCFILDPALTSNVQVTGYDIAPGQRAEVHHVILYVVDRAVAQARDAQDARPGWQCFGGAGVASTGALGAWAPGSGAVLYPIGGITLGQGQVLAMQVHYNTAAGVRDPDTSSVKLMYATAPVTQAFLLPLIGDAFSIPPASTGYTYTKQFANPLGFAFNVWGLLPHMHTLGKHITIRGTNDACLVDIPKWDFHWQQSYFTRVPSVTSGPQPLSLQCTWDNPTTRTITWGEGTSDEMCFAFVYVTL
jgi:hypothetical protein